MSCARHSLSGPVAPAQVTPVRPTRVRPTPVRPERHVFRSMRSGEPSKPMAADLLRVRSCMRPGFATPQQLAAACKATVTMKARANSNGALTASAPAPRKRRSRAILCSSNLAAVMQPVHRLPNRNRPGNGAATIGRIASNAARSANRKSAGRHLKACSRAQRSRVQSSRNPCNRGQYSRNQYSPLIIRSGVSARPPRVHHSTATSRVNRNLLKPSQERSRSPMWSNRARSSPARIEVPRRKPAAAAAATRQAKETVRAAHRAPGEILASSSHS